MNVKLLRKIQRHILAEPKRFIMGSYIQHKSRLNQVVIESASVAARDEWKFPRCGTAACIGGWAVLLTHYKSSQMYIVPDEAARLLGIENPLKLFSVGYWPHEFHQRFTNGRTPLQRAKAASARIDHFIKTKGAE